MNKLELVLPAGDLHRVKIAFLYGADAVYVGLDKYSLRKAEVKFTIHQIKKAIDYAHNLNKKLYVTFNIFAHNKHLKSLEKDMRAIAKFKPDAFIISDPGVVALAQEVAPKIPIHLSTQANTVNIESVKFWLRKGIKRIVLARELSLKEIIEIKKAVPKMGLEIFVHGAMCISYSGRCLLSAMITGRSANLGQCAQPCRWNYKIYSSSDPDSKSGESRSTLKKFSTSSNNNYYLEETKRPGEFYPIEEDGHGTYLMNSKDLCLIEHLDKIVAAGVTGLKVEGRNKTDFYVATVARAYRNTLATINNKQLTVNKKKKIIAECKKELLGLTHRDYTTGFLFGDAKKGETFKSREPIPGKKYLGFVEKRAGNFCRVIIKNKLEVDKNYELLTPDKIITFKITEMLNKNKNPITEANPGRKNEKILIKTNEDFSENTFIRSVR